MKILHLADLHLGKNVLGLSMIEDQRYVLNQALELCLNENIKNIIISGDVYDRLIPPEEAVSLLSEFLSRAVLEEKIHVYMISGNHDSKERLSCFNGLLEKSGLFIDGRIGDNLEMNKHVIEEDGIKINLYSLPYVFPGEVRVKINDENVKSFETAIIKVLENNKVNKDEINFINTHYFVAGSELPIISDSETRTSVGTIEQVSYKVFDEFDYVALGHLHCPQRVSRDTVRYAGSPLRYSVSEITQHKTFTVLEINSKEDIKVNEIDIVPLHEFTELKGTVDELTVNGEIKDFRILYFKLTDKMHVANAAARLKIKYPNYVGLEYVNLDKEDNGQITLPGEMVEELPLSEQFNKFFNYITEKELNDAQKTVVNEITDSLEMEDK